jgi:hypothetical protein
LFESDKTNGIITPDGKRRSNACVKKVRVRTGVGVQRESKAVVETDCPLLI